MLDPELTVHIAYTVKNRKPLEGSGTRKQKLPEILGGIPVSQSVQVLMLPGSLNYSKFEGSMNRVELVDIEVGETLRQMKEIEKISEVALKAKGEQQIRALGKLKKYKAKASNRLSFAKKTSKAYDSYSSKYLKKQPGKKKEQKIIQKQGQERWTFLGEAGKSESNISINMDLLYQKVQSQNAPQQSIQQISQAAIPPP